MTKPPFLLFCYVVFIPFVILGREGTASSNDRDYLFAVCSGVNDNLFMIDFNNYRDCAFWGCATNSNTEFFIAKRYVRLGKIWIVGMTSSWLV